MTGWHWLVLALVVTLLVQSRISERRRRQRKELNIELRVAEEKRRSAVAEAERLRDQLAEVRSGFARLPRPHVSIKQRQQPAVRQAKPGHTRDEAEADRQSHRQQRQSEMARLAEEDAARYSGPDHQP